MEPIDVAHITTPPVAPAAVVPTNVRGKFARPSVSRLSIVVLLLVISLIGNVGLGYWLWSIKTAPTTEEIGKQLVDDVGKVLVLPTDETPTIATVTDPTKLKSQPFFANAQTGDKVLIYQKAQKAILWRPSTSKVIEVSNVNTASQGSAGVGQ